MALEDEMQKEIKRLEEDVASINRELKLLHDRAVNLLMDKEKKERDLRALKGHFEPESENRDIQTTLGKI